MNLGYIIYNPSINTLFYCHIREGKNSVYIYNLLYMDNTQTLLITFYNLIIKVSNSSL